MAGCSKSGEKDVAQVEENYTPVEVEAAAIKSIANKLNFNGKVYANEEIAVIPKVIGTVTNVNIELGDVVDKGTVLFTIDKDDISKSVDQAANAIELAKKGVAQAENGYNTAVSNFELNKEKIENAQLNLERTRKLYEEGAISKSQLEQTELAASEKNLDIMEGQVNQAEIAHQQALDQLKQAELSYKQVASNLDNTVVTAPMDGIVSSLNVKKGQIITNSQPAVTIVDADKVFIQINVVENMVNKFEVGQEVEVNIPAAFDGYIPSTISYISPTSDMRSQLYPIKIYLENPDNKIKQGMNGKVNINMDQSESTIVVKSNAVLDKDDKKIVYVVEDDIAMEKEVEVGLDTGDFIEIKSGIIEGDKVVVVGQHYVENGGKVKVVRGE
jgi:multidrug efflux pump subunit AcrA (membrane-fusion protein)